MLTQLIAEKLHLALDFNVSRKRKLRYISLKELLDTLIEYKTAKDAAVILGISRSSVTAICKELFPEKESKQTWSQFLFSVIDCKRCSKCEQIKSLYDFADSKDKGKHIMCKPCLSEYGKVRYYENIQQHKDWNKNWRDNNPDKIRANCAQRRALKRDATTKEADLKVIEAIYKDCFDGYHVDHIIPLSRGGLHHEENLCYLPASLNLSKHNKLPEECLEIMKHAYFPILEAYK